MTPYYAIWAWTMKIWLVWAYLGSFFGPEGGPYGHKCVQFWKFILYFTNWVVAQLSGSNILGVMIEKLNFPQKTTHHPYGGEGGGTVDISHTRIDLKFFGAS